MQSLILVVFGVLVFAYCMLRIARIPYEKLRVGFYSQSWKALDRQQKYLPVGIIISAIVVAIGIAGLIL